MRIFKAIRKIVISFVVLAVLFVGAGVVYVLIADSKATPLAAPKKVVQQQAPTLPKPVAPAANSPEGASIESPPMPVTPGSNDSIIAMTNAGSKCSISVIYNGVQSTDSGLAPKTADAYGNVTWTWTVGSSVPVGNWPINVTCVYNGRSGVVASSVQVNK